VGEAWTGDGKSGRRSERVKQIIFTVSPDMWETYKAASSKKQGFEVSEGQAENLAKMDMWRGMQHTINTAQSVGNKSQIDIMLQMEELNPMRMQEQEKRKGREKNTRSYELIRRRYQQWMDEKGKEGKSE
jgi:hypothetical protein